MINIAKLLKDAPNGMKLYSPKFAGDFLIALTTAIILYGMIMWISAKITIIITGQGL